MGDAGFFKGTSADQDMRFSNKNKKLLKSMDFPPEFDEKVNMTKVKFDVIKPWITTRVTELLGFEDELVINFAFGLLEEKNPDPKMMQINLTGFLEKNTQTFILELWRLLLSAQQSKSGIPQKFLEEKKQEIMRNKEQQESAKARQEAVMDAIRRRKEAEEHDMRQDRGTQRKRPSRFDAGRPSSRSRSRSPKKRERSRSPPRRSSHRSSRRYGDSRSPPPRHRYRSRSPSQRSSHRRRYRSRTPPRYSRRHASPRDRSREYRRRRSPSTPRRRSSRRSVSPRNPSRSRSPSPKRSRRTSPPADASSSSSRRRRSASPAAASPPPKAEKSKWETEAGDEDGDPAEKTQQLREQALASLKKRRSTED